MAPFWSYSTCESSVSLKLVFGLVQVHWRRLIAWLQFRISVVLYHLGCTSYLQFTITTNQSTEQPCRTFVNWKRTCTQWQSVGNIPKQCWNYKLQCWNYGTKNNRRHLMYRTHWNWDLASSCDFSTDCGHSFGNDGRNRQHLSFWRLPLQLLITGTSKQTLMHVHWSSIHLTAVKIIYLLT